MEEDVKKHAKKLTKVKVVNSVSAYDISRRMEQVKQDRKNGV